MPPRTKSAQTRGQNQFKRGVSGGATPPSRYVGKHTIEHAARRIANVGQQSGLQSSPAGQIMKFLTKKKRNARYKKDVRRGGAHSIGNKK